MPGLPIGKARPKWTYREAKKWLQLNATELGRDTCEAPFGAETTLHGTFGDAPVDVLHRDAIVATWYPDGRIRLNPARLRTKSIRDRINVYTPATLFSRGGVWFIANKADPDAPWPFVDGMEVDESGVPRFGKPLASGTELPVGDGGDLAARLADALRAMLADHREDGCPGVACRQAEAALAAYDEAATT